MKRVRYFILFISVLVCLFQPLTIHAFSDIVVFGDSLSDVGNVYQATSWTILWTTPNEPYYEGRFSNGNVWVEHLAWELGLDASTPSAGSGIFPWNGEGTNFAVGGAHSDEHNKNLEEKMKEISDSYNIDLTELGFMGVTRQILWYLLNQDFDENRLFVLWAGGNDFLDGQQDPFVVAQNMNINLSILKNHCQAKHFLVLNLPPLGLTPRYLETNWTLSDQEKVNEMNTLSIQYNWFLNAILDNLEEEWEDDLVNIYRFNTFEFFIYVMQNKEQYGLTNISNRAYVEENNTIVSEEEVDGYLFWDSIHPTRKGHELLSAAVLEALPALRTEAIRYANNN